MWASAYIRDQLEFTTVLNKSIGRDLGLLKNKSETNPMSEEQTKGVLDTMTERVNEATECQHKIRKTLDFLAKQATKGLYKTQEETSDTSPAKRPRVDVEKPADKGTQTDASTSLAETWLASLA